MAITAGKSPLIATAANDAVVDRRIRVTNFRVVTAGSTGKTTILDQSGGRTIFETSSMAANSAEDSGDLFGWIDGFFVSALPTGATLYVYYQ